MFAQALVASTAGAATTVLLLFSLVFSPVLVRAQTLGQIEERSALERKLENEIMCPCGACRRTLANCGMANCGGHAVQTTKLKKLLAEGKDHDEIIATFVRDAGGQDVLAAPLDQGFNRLAWLLPYGVAALALFAIVRSARRWSQPQAQAVTGDGGVDPETDARLDDELRNLD